MVKVYTVSQITTYLRGLILRDPLLRSLSVSGELSNVRYPGSGNIFFTIKDEGAALSGVMFASDSHGLDFRLCDGMKVEVTGGIGVYDKSGTYQIYAKKIRREGRGELYERYLKLKEELEDMGMFADEYKQPIPEYIKRLGVVTASTGAAVRDIISIAKRRNPYVEILLYPAKVQGEGAAQSVARGIQVLDEAGVDVIIAGRGGGSIEDLWAFNERVVAEAVFYARTPVISAVGHETDYTIADFAADLRAPTPSAAAELAVYDCRQLEERFDSYREAIKDAIGDHIVRHRLRLKEAWAILKRKRPDAVIADRKMRLADIESNMRQLMARRVSYERDRASGLKRRMSDAMHGRVRDRRHGIAIYSEKLKGVSPLEKLTQGYSYVSDEEGRNIRDVSLLKKSDMINIYMLNGKVIAEVEAVEPADADTGDRLR